MISSSVSKSTGENQPAKPAQGFGKFTVFPVQYLVIKLVVAPHNSGSKVGFPVKRLS
jgi:hypothetical protein